MDSIETSILKARIRTYSLQRDDYMKRLEQLSDYSGIVLKPVPHRGKYIYYYKPKGSKKFKYIGDDSNHTVQLVKEARFLTESIERLESNIAALEMSSGMIRPLDKESVFAAMLEHFGRLDLPKYQSSVGFKIAQYMKKGYVPNVNFFMTFDVVGGSLDLQPLYDMILKIA